jgi:hypothetical protein
VTNVFGSISEPAAQTDSIPTTIETPRATPTKTNVVDWLESIFIPATTEETVTEISTPETDSKVFAGATFAAMLAAITAYSISEKRKREEEAARKAEGRKPLSDFKKKIRARKTAEMKTKEAQLREIAQIHQQQAIHETAKQQKINTRMERKEAVVEAEMKSYSAKPQEWEAGYNAYMAKKAMEDYRAGEKEIYVSESQEKEKNWWEKTIDVIDQHQPLAAVALGVAVGVGAVAIIATGGAATPLVIGGALLLAGGLTAGGTAALNAHYDRPLTQNMWKNVGYSAVSTLATIGIGMAVTSSITSGAVQQAIYRGGNAVASQCLKHPSVCARITAGVELWDKVEDLGLQAKLAIQTANGDPRAAETALELQLERLDNVPGNTTFREIYETAVDFFGRKSDEAVQIASTLARLGSDIQIDSDGLIKLGSDTAPEVIDEIVEELSEIPGRNVWASGSTIYINSSTQTAMDSVLQLKAAVANGADETTVNRLIDQVAAATTHGGGGRVVLGAWLKGDGYIGDAVENGGIFFDTGDDVWKVLKELEESGIEPWRINEAFLRQQLQDGVERIEFVGDDILDVINSTDISVRNSYRAKEIKWLLEKAKDYGYVNVGNSWVLP